MKLNVSFALVVSMLAMWGARLNADDNSNGDDFSVSVTGKVTAVDSTSVTVLGLKIALPAGLVITSNGNCSGDHGHNGNNGGKNGGDAGKNKGNKGGKKESNGGNNNGNGGKNGGDGGKNNGNGGNNGDNNGNNGNNNGNNGNHGGGDDKGDGDDNDDDNCSNKPATIAVGNFIKVDLTSDATPLTATDIHDWGGYGEGHYQLKAPIQAVTSNGNMVTITVLGLVVDVSTAQFNGCNDDDSQITPFTVHDLAVGQNVDLTLDAAKLPALVATHINVRKATNAVEVDAGDGDLSSDLIIDAAQKVTGIDPTSGKLVKKTIKLHMVTRSKKFALRGFFPGKAKIVYAYKQHKHAAKVMIAANGTTNLKLRLGK